MKFGINPKTFDITSYIEVHQNEGVVITMCEQMEIDLYQKYKEEIIDSINDDPDVYDLMEYQKVCTDALYNLEDYKERSTIIDELITFWGLLKTSIDIMLNTQLLSE